MSITRQTDRKHYEDRFGYRESGTFFNGTRAEYVLFAVTIGVMVGGVLFINYAILEPALYQVQLALFLAICSVLVNAVWVCIMLILANMFLTGYKCSYSCDREKAVIKTPFRKPRTIYYSEVIGIAHDELTYMGRLRGYVVTIHTKNGDYRYRPVFSNRYAAVNFDHTPFGIIEERVWALSEKAEPQPIPVTERFSADMGESPIKRYDRPEVQGPVFPAGKQQEDFSENTEKAASGGESGGISSEQMPDVSTRLTAENVVARLNAELAAAEQTTPPEPPSPSPALSERLSPAIDARNYRFDETEEKKQLVSTGFMYVERKIDLAAKWVILVVGIPLVIALTLNVVLSLLSGNLSSLEIGLVLLVAVLVIWITALRMSRVGYKLIYKANGEEMRIYDRKGNLREAFIYSDVEGVQHKPYKFLWMMCGYTVTITTKYKTVVYKWLFPDHYKFQDFKKSPFRIITDRMPGGSEYDEWD